MLETSKECTELLESFLNSLEQIQEEVENSDGAGFGCFPFYYDESCETCVMSNSSVCKLCRGLHEYKLVAEWREEKQ